MNKETVRHYINKHYPDIIVTVQRNHIYINRDPEDEKIVCSEVEYHDVGTSTTTGWYEIMEYRTVKHLYLPSHFQSIDAIQQYIDIDTKQYVKGIPTDFLTHDNGWVYHIPAGWKNNRYLFIEGTLKDCVSTKVFKRVAWASSNSYPVKIELLLMTSTTTKMTLCEAYQLGLLVGAKAPFRETAIDLGLDPDEDIASQLV